MTTFQEIYNRFLGKITEDMYLEWTEEDTKKDLLNILLDAIPGFEFPRFPLYDYDLTTKSYSADLTEEEINILALLMVNSWLQRQITSVENIRQKYSGSDFKMTSQANHLEKLIDLKTETERQAFHAQRLYKRRKFGLKNNIESNWSSIMSQSVFDD